MPAAGGPKPNCLQNNCNLPHHRGLHVFVNYTFGLPCFLWRLRVMIYWLCRRFYTRGGWFKVDGCKKFCFCLLRKFFHHKDSKKNQHKENTKECFAYKNSKFKVDGSRLNFDGSRLM